MGNATVMIPNLEVELTVDQIITAAKQLDSLERAKVVKMLAEADLDIELAMLISDLYSQPPVENISDKEISLEVQVVRQANRL